MLFRSPFPCLLLALFLVRNFHLYHFCSMYNVFFSLFPRFWVIFTIITLNSFSGGVVFLFPLHLFGLGGFYLAPLPARYFSVFSFCRITVFEVSFPEAAGLYFLLLLLSAPSGEVSPVACIGFLMGGTGACIDSNRLEST